MSPDPKRVVAAGYDRIAEAYAEAGTDRPDPVRAKYLAIALRAAPPGARALDLGCGTGALVTAALAARYAVVGVDISPRSIELARRALPAAEFLVADIAQLDLPAASFDLVTAFFSLIHLPRAEQPEVIAAIARWLRPGGTLVATLDAGEPGDWHAADWLGVPMFWSSVGRDQALAAVAAAGLTTVSAEVETVDEDDARVEHLWIVGQV